MESSTNKRYSGRFFSPQEIEQVRELIRTSAQMNRQQLSYRVCERFDWRKTDGSLKDMSCRVALLRMHREGLIELPAPRHKVNPCRSFARRTVQAQPGALLEAAVHELSELRLEVVARKDSALWNEYIDRYHYLGYKPLPGAQLRYFAYTGDRLLGLLGFGAAAWKTGPRDAWIGWSRAQRHRNLGGVVNNARFLVLPWVRVHCLASKLLSLISRELPGDRCPLCERGRLYPFRSLVRLRFTGQPLALVTRFELEQLRCGTCGALWVAPMPSEVSQETYDVSLKVNLALAHYHLGLPFKRLESFQAMLGMPLSDATQWDLVEQVADSAYPIYESLKKLGANQPLVYQDDTGARILSMIRENRSDSPPPRTGMYTTVLQFEGEHAICLYFTGRQHAGENLDDILAYRDPKLAPIQWMSDGLAANTPTQHQDQTLAINCIVHGRRKLVELEDYFPKESTQVIEAIAKVYKHEAECKEQRLTPDQRLAYHQQHSRGVMDDLKAWMEKQFEDRCVEPNSRLGGAFDYLLKRWQSLTRFLEVPGAPLDNNTAERALKMILRLRKNSLFYANAHGAYVGDILTSLIETCRLAGINPLEYLMALMHNRSAVFRDPGAWLPWNYRDPRDDASETLPLRHPPPVLGQPGLLGVAVPQ